MADSQTPHQYYRITPHPIDDRAYWDEIRTVAQRSEILRQLEQFAGTIADQPQVPSATDFLAARRSNDRSRSDRYWSEERRKVSCLAILRCLNGIDADEPDDRLLDWLWAHLTQATWSVVAHLPEKDLPRRSVPVLDLASCEMAAMFAEMRECLKPWMDSISTTLADAVLDEIDRRILTPFAEGIRVHWLTPPTGQLNNWVGVCAGSILAACDSLAAQGHPRPAARQRAVDALNVFLEQAFTEDGECDEGVGYWSYGLGFTCIGLSRMSADELAQSIDMERLKQVADYPRRVHLFDDCFYSGNDAPLRASAPTFFTHWLASATGNRWMAAWSATTLGMESRYLRHFSADLRLLEAARYMETTGTPALPPPPRVQYLPDQQVAMLRTSTPAGELLATLGGGTNAERHNHNDLGHFTIALAGRLIVPDLGNMHYTADFFGPRRYTYVAASSRGHNCPIIGSHEQRPGAEAAARVLQWNPQAAQPELKLDLTAAYPPEAGLLRWQRSLRQADAQMIITDALQMKHADTIEHVIWSIEKPQIRKSSRSVTIDMGPLRCEITPSPADVQVEPHSPADLRLREHRDQTLYRIVATFHADAEQDLEIATRFHAE